MVPEGLGTALKPALEPITMARKPLAGTVAACVLQHGTGALNVDGCRVPMNDYDRDEYIPNRCGWKDGAEYSNSKPPRGVVTNMGNGRAARGRILNEDAVTKGRWPANLIHDGSDEVVGLFPAQAGGGFGVSGGDPDGNGIYNRSFPRGDRSVVGFGDTGSAARFFYTAKATKAERQGVTHPTVKPLDLMAYLCRLVTPPGGIVLDPFMGSGTTIKAALSEGFNAIGIERDPAYYAMAQHRMDGAQLGLPLTTL
jgi:site-specific DNA-methyltransferase (adenine-specific)